MALNQVAQMGRLVADPELRKVNNDTSVVSFRIAVDRDFVNKETNQREADFFNVTAWRGLADFVAQYFAKGDMIAVTGRLQSRTYQDKDGNNRNTVEILAEHCYFGSAKKGESGASANEDDADVPF